MEKKIACFMPFSGKESSELTIAALKASQVVDKIIIVSGKDTLPDITDPLVSFLESDGLTSSATLRKLGELADRPYILLYTGFFPLDPGIFALKRLMQVCDDTSTGIVYSDYIENKDGKLSPHPVIDYQEGSLRDDFNFGSLIMYEGSAFRDACAKMERDYKFAGLYDLRLKISRQHPVIHLPELLYTIVETDTRRSGEKLHDYVNPRNRAVQIEMEAACTDHLKMINAWLKPEFTQISLDNENFKYEASVIIPVKNRVRTIGDAIKSVLSQETLFRFNLIVVDNYSSDGTSDVIRSLARDDHRIIHVIPERKDLGIGGCWNEGIFHPECGKFAIQLDSDDMYIDNNVIATIVRAFYEQNCAMVIGSYKMVNFNLEDIPPGLIDHREWTPDNGRNNALRINGLGAPRSFYVPVLRNIRIPNVSYGEDYAVGLAISRHYRIGRIYDPLYLCRRWDENSDAALDVHKANSHDLYKDRIRTIELLARKKINSGSRV